MIHVGNCLDILPTLPAESVDAIVTDPPYGIGFMGKAWDGANITARMEARRSFPSKDPTATTRGAHGSAAAAAGQYDLSPKGMRAFQDFSAEWARAAMRVLKPGGHIVVFASPRTYHRMVCGLEEAGFEIRDTLMWLFGSGFPKSKNLDGAWEGWGTALKPAHEPICLARKPLRGTVAANVATHRTGALHIDRCRIETDEDLNGGAYSQGGRSAVSQSLSPTGMNRPGASAGEYIQPTGRWPANVIHDGSDEVLAAFPHTESGKPAGIKAGGQGNAFGHYAGGIPVTGYGDAGSAARFFYCAKASREDREGGLDGMPLRQGGMVSNTSGQHITRRDGGAPGPVRNHHPTVKPTDLMRWLCRLITPPGGVILDPFMGSGSTGRAASAEGFQFIGIELDPEYAEIARRRIAAVQPGLALAVTA